MLAELQIRDIVLIDRLDIRFSDGLSVLTGETGAGKSILLDAFSLALGARGDGGLVRHGEASGQVTAVFDLPDAHPAREIAQASDLGGDAEMILRRVQFADGRTRAFVNDQPVSVAVLRAIGRTLVEIHGQHDDRALMDPASHRGILDSYASLQVEVGAVADTSRRLRSLGVALAEHETKLEAARRERDYLAHSAEELTALAPKPGEEAALSERRQVMMGSEKVAQDLADALEAVSGSGSAVPALSAILRKFERRGGPVSSLMAQPMAVLESLLVAYDEAAAALDDAVRSSEFDPAELERTEERLFRLRSASRKFAVPPDELPDLLERLETQLSGLDSDERTVAELRIQLSAADHEYVGAAERLSVGRRKAAERLAAAIGRELKPLRLERASFVPQVETDPTSRDPAGFDRVEFWAQTNPGSRPGPLMKVASGGELSRFILAVKVVLADRGSAPTLVFDEIDTGVGGAVSDAIGRRLAKLSERVQVMAITHAPQVAARALNHFLIAKEAVAGSKRVATRIAALDATPRREEIARMLAGASVTDEARAAAGKLIEAGGSA